MRANGGIDHPGAQRFELRQSPFLVDAHQPRIADHIRDKDRGKAPTGRHVSARVDPAGRNLAPTHACAATKKQ
jgi:hypothetical protein